MMNWFTVHIIFPLILTALLLGIWRYFSKLRESIKFNMDGFQLPEPLHEVYAHIPEEIRIKYRRTKYPAYYTVNGKRYTWWVVQPTYTATDEHEAEYSPNGEVHLYYLKNPGRADTDPICAYWKGKKDWWVRFAILWAIITGISFFSYL